MNFKTVIGVLALIFVFIIACAGTSEKSGTEQPAKLNVDEPWTGTWHVTGIGDAGAASQDTAHILELKQNGNRVISTQGSMIKFEGECSGNELKGSHIDDHGLLHRLNVKISDDLKSFEGEDRFSIVTRHVKGVRQE